VKNKHRNSFSRRATASYQHHFGIGEPWRDATASHHEEHEALEGNSATVLNTTDASLFFYELAHGIARAFMSFMVRWGLI